MSRFLKWKKLSKALVKTKNTSRSGALKLDSIEYDVESLFPYLERSLDPDFYLRSHPDLKANLSTDTARPLEHYLSFGLYEGRQISEIGIRAGLLKYLDQKRQSSLLEVGPFMNPVVIGDNVKYFEVLDQQALKSRAEQIGYPIKHIPKIDFIDENGDLACVDEKFDFVVSSHCIEHQTNFIDHLNKVGSILKETGVYFVLCPDKRACFDHFNTETKLIDIISADLDKRKVHPVRSVLEHRTFITHNKPSMHWKGEHGGVAKGKPKLDAIKRTLDEIETNKNSYIDVHSWIFTPLNFAMILEELNELSMVNLKLAKIFPTVRGQNEFIAMLVPNTTET